MLQPRSSSCLCYNYTTNIQSVPSFIHSFINMEVLNLLEEYYAAHEAAAVEWKSAQWSLTLARRAAASRSPTLTVATPLEASLLVRYELEPQTVVVVTTTTTALEEDDDDDAEVEVEPDLIVTDQQPGATTPIQKPSGGQQRSSTSHAAAAEFPPRFTMVNVAEEREKHKENAQRTADNLTSSSSVVTDGLRQRKGGGGTMENNKNTTTAANHKNAKTTTVVEELPETSYQTKNDPVLLLAGMLPPRELRMAQQKATVALQKYIDVANLLVELQTKLCLTPPAAELLDAVDTRTTQD
jgi:hypothetical protein